MANAMKNQIVEELTATVEMKLVGKRAKILLAAEKGQQSMIEIIDDLFVKVIGEDQGRLFVFAHDSGSFVKLPLPRVDLFRVFRLAQLEKRVWECEFEVDSHEWWVNLMGWGFEESEIIYYLEHCM